MKKIMSLMVTVTMLVSMFTGLALTADAKTAETASLANTNNINWVLENNTLVTDTLIPWYDNTAAYTIGLDSYDFGNVALIKTKRYEPASSTGPWKELYAGLTSETVETLTVNNSCEVYVFYPTDAIPNCGKWLLDQGYQKCAVNIKSEKDGTPELRVYKKEFYVGAGKTLDIPLGAVNSNWVNQMCSFAVRWVDVPVASLANTNNINWVLENNVSVTDALVPWYDNDATYTTGLEAYDFGNAALIKTKRYEPASSTGPWKELYAGLTSGTVETLTVNNSCEVYVFYPTDATPNCGKWLLDQGYTKCETNLKSNKNGSPEMRVYKKAFPLGDSESLDIPLGAVNSNWFNQMCAFLVSWKELPTLTLANTNNLNWKVLNNTSVTSSTLIYNDEPGRFYGDLNGYDFSDVSLIQPGYAHYNLDISKGKTYETIETMTINNSADVYIISSYKTSSHYHTWIDNFGYELMPDKIKDSGNNEFLVYKRTYLLMDKETLDIPLGASNGIWWNKRPYTVIVKWRNNPETMPARVHFTSIGANSSLYALTENAYVGERIHIGGGRIIKSFNNSDIAGASIIKPYAGDSADPNYSVPDPANATDNDFYSVTINKTATVYVAARAKFVDGSYMWWLCDWTLAKDSNGNEMTINIQNDDGKYNYDWYLYKKTFAVPNGETRTINLKNAKLFASEMYVPFVKFTDETTYPLTITTDSGAVSHPSGTEDIISGEKLLLNIVPKDGYFIKSIKLNGVEVSGIKEGAFTYETPAITSSSTLEIESDLLSNIPLPESLPYVPTAFSGRENNQPFVINGKRYLLNVIGFATAKEIIGQYERGDFGMLVSLDQPSDINEMIVTNHNLIKVPAESANTLGQYGIRLYGDNIVSGQKVYMRAYANYDGTVIYGDGIIEATF